MDNNEEELYTTIDYHFNGEYDGIPFLEDICRSLNIDVEKYWMRELDELDILTGENVATSKTKPLVAELYELTYSLLISNKKEAINRFAEFLIDNMLETWGQLEGCLKLEIDKKEK